MKARDLIVADGFEIVPVTAGLPYYRKKAVPYYLVWKRPRDDDR